MAEYMVQVSYSTDGWAGLLSKPQNRLPVVAAVIAKLGGKLLHGWLTFGEYDTMVIADFPDNTAAASFAAAIAAGGSCRSVRTTPLLSADEGISAMRKAASSGYQPVSK